MGNAITIILVITIFLGLATIVINIKTAQINKQSLNNLKEIERQVDEILKNRGSRK
jgi:hypothetical protein